MQSVKRCVTDVLMRAYISHGFTWSGDINALEACVATEIRGGFQRPYRPRSKLKSGGAKTFLPYKGRNDDTIFKISL